MKTLTVTLKQHTPLIHFQHDQYGATLRASEVKPKLDKFVLTKLGGGNYEKGISEAEKEGLLVGKGEHPALNYKISIKTPAEQMKIWLINQPKKYTDKDKERGRKYIEDKQTKYLSKKRNDGSIVKALQQYPLFFGNMDKNIDDPSEYRKMVYTDAPIELRVWTKNEKIFAHMQKLDWCDFFLINNFGTRQSKGFGSFYIQKGTEYYTKDPGSKYKFTLNSVKEQCFKDLFDAVELFYKSLRSGVNYPGKFYFKSLAFMYAKEVLGKHWDKRMIKEEFYNTFCHGSDSLPLQIGKHMNKEPLAFTLKKNEGCDIRDLLGFSTKEQWSSFNDAIEKKVAIKDNSKYRYPDNNEKLLIERMPSPILIKPIFCEEENKYKIYLIFREQITGLDEFKSQGKICVLSFKEKKKFMLDIPSDFTLEKYFDYIFQTLKFNINSHVESTFHKNIKFELLKEIYEDLERNLKP